MNTQFICLILYSMPALFAVCKVFTSVLAPPWQEFLVQFYPFSPFLYLLKMLISVILRQAGLASCRWWDVSVHHQSSCCTALARFFGTSSSFLVLFCTSWEKLLATIHWKQTGLQAAGGNTWACTSVPTPHWQEFLPFHPFWTFFALVEKRSYLLSA